MIETRRPSRIASDYSLRMSWKPEVDEIERLRALARQQGGAEAVERQHARGRLTVRERIEALVDPAQLPRTRRAGRRVRAGRGRRAALLRARERRGGDRAHRRAAGRRGRRRFHDPRRRLHGRGSAQGAVRRRAGDPTPDPGGAPARGRRRLGDRRLGRARPVGLRPHGLLPPEPPVHGGARDGARRVRGARSGGGLPRRAAGRLALLADDAADGPGAHGRAGPGRARARREALQRRARRRRDPPAQRRRAERRRGRAGRLATDPRVPRLPARERLGGRAGRSTRAIRRPARRRS